ncbi:hypothetical protein PILCRDRAFT_810751 [Piloderma croceum F 1598]|uniref:Uncharacterized protein n=1 Tax=Piloderma croceum (strain F 1598) TaxID=765440 RepID=A0A0C3GLM9_PILCF|nr:hypothetical protein PILCRDRAFT_810751 [Piloderma croceum F 1598]
MPVYPVLLGVIRTRTYSELIRAGWGGSCGHVGWCPADDSHASSWSKLDAGLVCPCLGLDRSQD